MSATNNKSKITATGKVVRPKKKGGSAAAAAGAMAGKLAASQAAFAAYGVPYRGAPNMLKNLPIIPSRTSQNLSLLFFKIPLIIPKLFRSDSNKIIAYSYVRS